ncbi:MAG: PLP-dependent aspartate aminotransferase family protein [Coriobacteriales bacterium]|nr:PLP-dependent aspartate aminotransferase family protein [Coriobacteriales bacterium]
MSKRERPGTQTPPLHLESQVVHAPGDGDERFGDVVAPIHLTTTYRQDAFGRPPVYDYSRGGNPSRQIIEDQIALLETGGGSADTPGERETVTPGERETAAATPAAATPAAATEGGSVSPGPAAATPGAERPDKAFGLAYSTGMAAITGVLALFEPGDEILAPTNLYGGTFRVIDRFFSRFGLTCRLVDITDLGAIDLAFGPKTKAVLFESPTNPLLSIADIRAVSQIAHAYGALSIVDNTFLTPYLQRPLELGADIVVHSATKYLGGHSDVLAGLTVVRDEALYKRLHFIQYTTGATLSAFDSYLLTRGIKTLALRVERQCANAEALARWLQEQKQVEKVYYPGLPEHPGYELNRSQAGGAGGMLAFELTSDIDPQDFVSELRLILLAESLGAVESLICHPATMTHASIPADLRREMGIGERLLRLSVGIEHIDDLKADLKRGFAATA